MKRKYLIIIGIIIILSGLLFIGYRINEQRREDARMAEEQREIEETYRRLHYAIGRLSYDELRTDGWERHLPEVLEQFSSYQPLDPSHKNESGIFFRQYYILRMYYHHGDIYLSYEMLVDYFSEEFEPDGSLRLYNNGHHPEIEAFIIWMWEGHRWVEFIEYEENLNNLRTRYISENSIDRFSIPIINHMSHQMLDALARAEADPDYVLDLTSLQEQGY